MRQLGSGGFWGVLLVVSIVLMSGCAAKAKTTTSLVNASAQVDDDTGGIEGAVVDEEDVPLPGTDVGIIGLEGMETTTDEAGFFSFSHVPPGKYSLQFVNTGYEPALEWVEVVAGEVATGMTVKLVKMAIVEPFHEVSSLNGLFGCGSSWRPAVVYSGIAVCGLLALGAEVGVDTTPYDQFLLVWSVDGTAKGWSASVFEMAWNSNQFAGKGLSMIWEVDGCPNFRSLEFARAQGRNPLSDSANLTQINEVIENAPKEDADCEDASVRCNKDACAIMSRVFSQPDTLGPTSAADIGFTFQQPFTQYHTAFYHTPAPDAFTALL